MPREALTGSRIRDRRVMAGLKQAELARQIGISASYLNLIEHNRRRIGGKLLLNIAAALEVEPQALTEGAEAALIATLREAADQAALSGQELDRADEFAGRFPGWADVLARTRRRVASLEQTVEALTDRLGHDPHLAASMHELLTTAAAIRSTASILDETETLQPEWRDRFHANLNEDSHRLSDSAEALVRYFDGTGATQDAASSPQEEVESFLADHAYHFEILEKENPDPEAIAQIIDGSNHLVTQTGKHIAEAVLKQVLQDAKNLDLPKLRSNLSEGKLDPLNLAAMLKVSLPCVLRRLAALPELGAGLVVCDRSGTVIFRKSIEGFTVPRHGSCCPLWPLFAVLGQPGLVVTERVSQMGRAQAQFDCYATSEVISAPRYNSQPLTQAVMLLLPADAGGMQGHPVGSTCRVCPHSECHARREPSILSAGM